MFGEYGVLLGGNGLMPTLHQVYVAMIHFLRTPEGQIAAAVVLAALFLIYGRKK
ncbi:hypothetical protein [Methylomicrobium lacus]|uniref:hypothetical protein n=1 Tax=Methylomicrobium lacus TaxID=136992 RepID=UPI0004B183E6|nr:hypothetical protein [Methylomicrobium lacus]